MDELRGIILQTEDLMQKAARQQIDSCTIVELIRALAEQIMKLREAAGFA